MKESVDIMRGARRFIVNLIDGISIEKLNEIPHGFNNNLAWNIGHVIATQQIFCYRNAGVKPVIDDKVIDKYKTGTHPENFIDEKEFKQLLQHLVTTVDQFEKDAAAGVFTDYKPLDFKSYPGLRVENISDAAQFVSFHDGLHVGYCMALKRALKK